jgi:hypothetical protein
VLSPDEEKEISIQEKKKESLLWEKPAPPKPFLLHLGLTARDTWVLIFMVSTKCIDTWVLIFMVSTKCIDTWVLIFMVSNTCQRVPNKLPRGI